MVVISFFRASLFYSQGFQEGLLKNTIAAKKDDTVRNSNYEESITDGWLFVNISRFSSDTSDTVLGNIGVLQDDGMEFIIGAFNNHDNHIRIKDFYEKKSGKSLFDIFKFLKKNKNYYPFFYKNDMWEGVKLSYIKFKVITWLFDWWEMVIEDISLPQIAQPVSPPPVHYQDIELVKLTFNHTNRPDEAEQHFVFGYSYQNRDIRFSLKKSWLKAKVGGQDRFFKCGVYSWNSTFQMYELNQDISSCHSGWEDNLLTSEGDLMLNDLKKIRGEWMKYPLFNPLKKTNFFPKWDFTNLDDYAFSPYFYTAAKSLLQIDYPRPVLPNFQKTTFVSNYEFQFLRDYNNPRTKNPNGIGTNAGFIISAGNENGVSSSKFEQQIFQAVKQWGFARNLKTETINADYGKFVSPIVGKQLLGPIEDFRQYGYSYAVFNNNNSAWKEFPILPKGKVINSIILLEDKKTIEMVEKFSSLPKTDKLLRKFTVIAKRKYNPNWSDDVIKSIGFNIYLTESQATYLNQEHQEVHKQLKNDVILWNGNKFIYNPEGFNLDKQLLTKNTPFYVDPNVSLFLKNILFDDPANPTKEPFNFAIESGNFDWTINHDWGITITHINDIQFKKLGPSQPLSWWERLFHYLSFPMRMIEKVINIIANIVQTPRLVIWITMAMGMAVLFRFLGLFYLFKTKKR